MHRRLFASIRKDRIAADAIHLFENLLHVYFHRFEQHALANTADAHLVALETKLLGQTHGLAETIDESIRYPIRTQKDREEMGPCVVAGPTCDSMDVLYQKTPYPLPVSLAIGDKVLLEAAGAYTTTYSSVGFNGYPPLKQYVI